MGGTLIRYRSAERLGGGGQRCLGDWRAGRLDQAIAGGADSRAIDCGKIGRGLADGAFAQRLRSSIGAGFEIFQQKLSQKKYSTY